MHKEHLIKVISKREWSKEKLKDFYINMPSAKTNCLAQLQSAARSLIYTMRSIEH